MSEYSLGVDICFGKKRWPEAKHWSKIVKEELGLKLVEFDSDYLDPLFVSAPARFQIADETREIVEANNIQMHSYFTGTMTHCVNLLSHPDKRVRKDGYRWVEEAIHLATHLGVKGIGGHFDTIATPDWQNSKRYRFFINNIVESLISLSRVAKKENHQFMLLEQMYSPSEVPYTIEQARWLFSLINEGADVPVLPVIDIGHACSQNFSPDKEQNDPYVWLDSLGRQAPVIHLHQTTLKESCHWPFTREYNKMGIIHPEKVLEALENSGVRETNLILEIFFPLGCSDKQVIKDMVESVEYWRRYLPNV